MTDVSRQRLRYVINDYVMTNVAWAAFNVVRFYWIVDNSFTTSLWRFMTMPTVLWGQLLFPVMMLGIYILSGYYNHVFLKSRLEELINTITTTFIGTILIYFIAIIDDPIPDRASNYQLLAMLELMLFASVYISRLIVTWKSIKKIRRGEWTQNALVIGVSDEAVDYVTHKLAIQRRMGLNVVGFVSLDESGAARVDNLPVYRFEDIAGVCADKNISNLILIPPRRGVKTTLEIINALFPLGLPIFVTPDIFDLIMSRSRFRNVIGEPLIDISRADMAQSTVNLKRAGDIVVSALALIVLSPLLAAIAVAVRRDSPGPVIYSQERVGYQKRKFNILKFRTMAVDAESTGPALSTPDDPRITRVGRVLRKYRLDELPQFWNVLKGDMSLVGPRPEREYYISRIVEKAPYYTLVHQVRPGITSWGMVKYGYASNVDEMIERLKYDLLYIENVSMLVDLKILFYTVNTVITGKGI